MSAFKVCHMTSVHGAEDVRIFHKECVSLVQAGYEVYLVERGESYDKNGVHIVGVGEISGHRLKRMTKGAKRVYEKALALDCDIYHLHDPELLPYGMKLKEKGKKVIFDSHENTAGAILEKKYIPALLRSLIHRLYVVCEKQACGKLDAVVTVTPSMTRAFESINSKAVEVRNYPCYCAEYSKPQMDNNMIIFAGGITPQWNHHILLKALEQLPAYAYCLCGTGNETYLRKLQQMPAWERVNYLGRITHSEVQKELSKASVGVALLQPGKNTDGMNGTMGNTKIFEEMMAGLPVICTDFKLWREFVDRYQCGICINPDNIDELVSAIRFLSENHDKAKEMGENGHRAVRDEFCWEKGKEPLLALYAKLCKD